MASRLVRRVAVGMAATLAAVTATMAVGTPANAIPPLCEDSWYYYFDGANNIYASNWRYCEYSDVPRALPVSIEVFNNSNSWTTLVTGAGDIAFFCSSTAGLNRFRILGIGIGGGNVFEDRCTV